jgi:hypothetical protein
MVKKKTLPTKVCMDSDELAKVNANAHKFRMFEKDKELIDTKMQLLQVKEALLQSQLTVIEKDRIILRMAAEQNTLKFVDFKEDNKSLMISIAKSHGLEGSGFGYDPESGEIIPDK